MAGGGIAIAAIDAVARETMLFAAVGFLIGGLDDLLVDLLFVARLLLRRFRASEDREAVLADHVAPMPSGRLAVFVPAWDESAVIGAMLRTALGSFDHPDYRIYVGTYPNDPATIDAVAAVAEHDPRIRLAINPRPGPTTKADCLNTLWRALRRDEAEEGFRARAVVIHDAEDVVHPGELRLFDRLIETADVVQLPVLPLVDRGSRLVSGHYLDEFAEAHGKQLLVRQAIGAGLPLAGTGCAVARAMLERIAMARGGDPFDATSLTEDYELGLTIAAMGGRGVFARVPERRGGPPVAVRAFFPGTLEAAVRQKARWMTGIALAGWDRTGWSRARHLNDHWMRMRDRRALLSVLVLAVAYAALLAWGVSALAHLLFGAPLVPPAPEMRAVLLANAAILLWRVGMRMWFVGRVYGRTEALLSLPRMLVANLIALLAARRAMGRYIGLLRGREPRWDKTAHRFPDPARGNAR